MNSAVLSSRVSPRLISTVMISSANRALSALAQNFSIRYGLDRTADEQPIEDFETMLRVGVNFEIVTGALPIHAIGCLGKSRQTVCLPARSDWSPNRSDIPGNFLEENLIDFL